PDAAGHPGADGPSDVVVLGDAPRLQGRRGDLGARIVGVDVIDSPLRGAMAAYGHETDPTYGPAGRCAVLVDAEAHERHTAAEVGPHRGNDHTAWPGLGDPGIGQLTDPDSGRGDHALVRSSIRTPGDAITGDGGYRKTCRVQRCLGEVGQHWVDLHRGHVRGAEAGGQQRCMVTGPGADLEHVVAVADVQGGQHAQHQFWFAG